MHFKSIPQHVQALYLMLLDLKFRVRIIQSDRFSARKNEYDKLVKFWWCIIDVAYQG